MVGAEAKSACALVDEDPRRSSGRRLQVSLPKEAQPVPSLFNSNLWFKKRTEKPRARELEGGRKGEGVWGLISLGCEGMYGAFPRGGVRGGCPFAHALSRGKAQQSQTIKSSILSAG